MRRRNPFDAAHEVGAEQVSRFIDSMLKAGELPSSQARLHGDNAYVLVEFLANTYPKVPAEANERDAWIFLFDYSMSQGPFSGPAVALVPRSTELFFDFLASERRVAEIDFIRAACRQGEFYKRRVDEWGAIAAASDTPSSDAEEVDRAVYRWQDELAARMRPLGLVPDTTLAPGEAPWQQDMGPVEAAVFDAVCVLLARRARSLSPARPAPEELERTLIEEQERFMRAHNRGLGMAPLAAVIAERQRIWGQAPGPDR